MNKLNPLGTEILNIKEELNKEYSRTIKNALNLVVDNLAKEKEIDEQISFLLKSDYDKISELNTYLLENSKYCKSKAELESEYEIIKCEVLNQLTEHKVEKYIKIINFVEKEKISVIQRFLVSKDFCCQYFRTKEEDMDKLMSRKNFIEKFVVLRYSAIINNFLQTIEYPKELFDCNPSLVYYDAPSNNFGIDLIFDIKIENLEVQEKIKEITANIKDICLNANDYVASRLVI